MSVHQALLQPLDVSPFFSASYAEARRRFLHACEMRDLVPMSHLHEATGPEGEALATDVVSLGSADAERVLIATSATHGVEGFLGSAAQIAFLHRTDPGQLPPSVRVVLVHALNPHGFAWLRRVNEDNVDLNRNFVAFDGALPPNQAYAELHGLLIPDEWSAGARGDLLTKLDSHAQLRGEDVLQRALSRGQYAYPDGIFFGGREAVWSNRTFRAVLRAEVETARHVGFIDFHTGLGPYGHGELITKRAHESSEARRLLAWYGPAVKSSASGDSTSPELSGVISTAVRDVAAAAAVSAITAEFGTYPLREVLMALLADNWLHARGDSQSSQGRSIKRHLLEMFAPADEDWRALVLIRSLQLMTRGIAGLAASGASITPGSSLD